MRHIIKIANNNKTIFHENHTYFFRSRENYSDGFDGKFIGLSILDDGFLFELSVPLKYKHDIEYHMIDGTNVNTHSSEMGIPHSIKPTIRSRKEELLKFFMLKYDINERILEDNNEFQYLIEDLKDI